MFIIALFVVISFLLVCGTWGVVSSTYEELEELLVQPILRLIANMGVKGLIIFLPVCIFFMSIRRAVTFSPAWISLYLIMVGCHYPDETIYNYLKLFIVCAGMIKTASVMRLDYYSESKLWNNKQESDTRFL